MGVQKSPNGRFIQRFIPARVVFVVLGFFGFFLVYAYKVVLSMAIVAMVRSKPAPPVNTTTTATPSTTMATTSASFLLNLTIAMTDMNPDGTCPGVKSVSKHEGDFDWDDSTKNYVLASFFYGYVLTQIPAGILANKFGGKWIYGLSIFISAICSILCPLAARQSAVWLMVLRVIQGLALGVVYPCMSGMIGKWMPKMERTRGTTIIYTGAMIGTVVTLPMASEFNVSSWGWPASFYTLGIMGVVWFALWATLCYETPDSHPFISQKEHDYILSNGGGQETDKNIVIPYRKMFRSKAVYGLIFTNFGQNWAFLTVLTYMPTYMKDVLHTSDSQDLIISGLPYMGQAVFGWIVSYVTDRVRSTGRFEITTIRKFNNFIAFGPSAVCIALVPFVGCNQIASCVLLIISISLNGACFSALNSTHVDMAPDFAGTLMGISNSFGNMPGFLVPKVVELFVHGKTTIHSWAAVFYMGAAVDVFTILVYTFMCTAQEQSWGRAKKLDNP